MTTLYVDNIAPNLQSSVAIPGHVIQVVESASTTANVVNNTTWTASSLTATITPSATTSKILVLFHGCYDIDAAGRQIGIQLRRGTTAISGGAESAASKPYSGSSRAIGTVAVNHLDSPSTTSATTYTVYIKSHGSYSTEFISQSTEARMTLMEIAG